MSVISVNQLDDFFRETGEVAIYIPALPRPIMEQLQGKFSWIKSVKSDTSPTHGVMFKLGTVLRSDEERVRDTEYENRLVSKFDISLGYQHACWLVEHQDEFSEFMAMGGKIYIDFPGLAVVDADGRPNFPCLNQVGGRWCLFWSWVGIGLIQLGRIAVFDKNDAWMDTLICPDLAA